MTGFMHAKFRYKCAERGVCYNTTLPDVTDLFDEVFPRGIIPTDIDAMVEVNDSFLFLEFKKRDVALPNGQRKALVALTRRDRVTVAFIRDGLASDFDVNIIRDGAGSGARPCSRSQLRAWLTRWALEADALGQEAS